MEEYFPLPNVLDGWKRPTNDGSEVYRRKHLSIVLSLGDMLPKGDAAIRCLTGMQRVEFARVIRGLAERMAIDDRDRIAPEILGASAAIYSLAERACGNCSRAECPSRLGGEIYLVGTRRS